MTAPPGDIVDAADVFRSIRNGIPIIAGFGAAGLVAALLVLAFVPPVFSGKASVLLKTGSSGSGGSSLAAAIGSLADVAGGGGSGGLPSIKTGVETEVEILQSRALAAEIVDSFHLQAQVTRPRATPATRVFTALNLPGSFKRRVYTFTPSAGAATPRQYRFVADGDSGVAVVGGAATLAIGSATLAEQAPREAFKVVFTDHDDAVTRLTENLHFDKTKSDVAHFEYTGTDSVSAAGVPNLLINLYLQRRKGVDRGLNQRTAEFLSQKVDSVGRALSVAENALRLQRESSGMIDPLTLGATEYGNENRLRQQLTDILMQEKTLQQLVTKIRDGSYDATQLATYPPFLANGAINNIVGSLISVQTEREALLTLVTEQDERVKALTTRSRQLEARLLPLAQSTLSTLASQRSALDQRIQGIQTSVAGVPRAAEQYTRLERQVLDLGKIYAGLQIKLVDARLNAITEGGDVRPLDLATAPKKPSFPKRSVTLAAGTGGGLFVGVILAVLLGITGRRMYAAQDIERWMGLPAVRMETSSPLLVGGPVAKTILVASVDKRARSGAVAERLVETALSRSMTATLLDLSRQTERLPATSNGTQVVGPSTALAFDANAAIRRLEETHDLVVVQLSELGSREAAAVLDGARRVLLVAPERRISRDTLQSAVDLLRRVGAPCAGVVLYGDDRQSRR
jgi:uncharacterized protein involved in exopolysaccharide biosynthesis